nr:helix-turn-helix transcriptional regulator [Candidatus Hamiltonella defensa]
MRSRGETKASFSERSGITRTTIYKILEGKVNKVQETTLHKIASFFGFLVMKWSAMIWNKSKDRVKHSLLTGIKILPPSPLSLKKISSKI